MVDAGYKIEYDDTKDSYLVHADDETVVFKRRLLQNGKRSPHYSYMPNATGKWFQEQHSKEMILVETVADNIRRFTKREVKSARAGRDLMAKLGHASLQSSIKAVNRGIRFEKCRSNI